MTIPTFPHHQPSLRALALLFLCAFTALAQERLTTLDVRARSEISQTRGKVSLFAKNLDTGESYAFNPDDRVRTASTIKLPILVAVHALVAEGKVKWDAPLLLTEAKKVKGAGILMEFGEGLKLTLRDAVNLMVTISDNTATNLVLDAITADAVNEKMEALGLKQTRSLRKIGGGGASRAGSDPANQGFGIGVSTPREMVTLIEKIERGEVVSPAASKEMIELLKRQQYRDGIGRRLLGLDLAAKPGALDRLRSEVGILYTPRGRIAMAMTIDDMPEIAWTVDNPGLLLISRLSEILAEGLGRP